MYFSASFIFVPEAPGLKDQDTSIVKLETNDDCHADGILRSAGEQTEDAVKFFDEFTVTFLSGFHTVVQQNQLEVLKNSRFHSLDIYLSLRRLQV